MTRLTRDLVSLARLRAKKGASIKELARELRLPTATLRRAVLGTTFKDASEPPLLTPLSLQAIAARAIEEALARGDLDALLSDSPESLRPWHDAIAAICPTAGGFKIDRWLRNAYRGLKKSATPNARALLAVGRAIDFLDGKELEWVKAKSWGKETAAASSKAAARRRERRELQPKRKAGFTEAIAELRAQRELRRGR